jgi:hypothetical protein
VVAAAVVAAEATTGQAESLEHDPEIKIMLSGKDLGAPAWFQRRRFALEGQHGRRFEALPAIGKITIRAGIEARNVLILPRATRRDALSASRPDCYDILQLK